MLDIWNTSCKNRASSIAVALVVGVVGITPALAITEAQFIEKVLAQDKLLEESQIGLDIKQIELDASRDNYQNWKANLSVGVDYGYRDLKRQTTSTSNYFKKTKQYPKQIGLSVQKRFLSSPGSLAFGIRRSKDRTTYVRYRQRAYRDNYIIQEYQTEHYISFKYPLLKHDYNALSLKTYHRDIVDLARQQLLFYETKEDFLDDRMSDYLAWFLYQEEARINQEYRMTLQRLQPQDAAEDALLTSALYQIEQYHSNTARQLQAIKEKLSILLDDETILTETATFDLHQRAELVERNLRDYLQARSRALQRIALSLQLKQIDVAYYQNQRLPALDFTARAEKNLSSGNTLTTRYANDETDYVVGLELRYPLSGNITNRANLQKSRLGHRKLEISYQETLQDLLADIQLLNTLLLVDEQRLLAAIAAAQQSASIELQNYHAGQTSFRDLLQAYKEARLAKLERINTIIDYQINSIKYDNLLDRMIDTPCLAAVRECGG